MGPPSPDTPSMSQGQWDLRGFLESMRRARRRPIVFNILAMVVFGIVGAVTIAQNLAQGALTTGTAAIGAAAAGVLILIALLWLIYLPQGPTNCRIDDVGVRFEYQSRPAKLLLWSDSVSSVSFLDYGPPRIQVSGKPYQPGPFGQRYAMKGGRPRYAPLPSEVFSAILSSAERQGLTIQSGRLPTTRGGVNVYHLSSKPPPET
jgi:hypothetical protein